LYCADRRCAKHYRRELLWNAQHLLTEAPENLRDREVDFIARQQLAAIGGILARLRLGLFAREPRSILGKLLIAIGTTTRRLLAKMRDESKPHRFEIVCTSRLSLDHAFVDELTKSALANAQVICGIGSGSAFARLFLGADHGGNNNIEPPELAFHLGRQQPFPRHVIQARNRRQNQPRNLFCRYMPWRTGFFPHV